MKLVRQIFVFGIVGIVATVTHYLIALQSINIANLDLHIANLVGYVTAILVSYFGHGLLTFKIPLSRKVFIKFITTSVGTFLLSELILVTLEKKFVASDQISLLIVVLSIPILSFILNKFWVFDKPAREPKLLS